MKIRIFIVEDQTIVAEDLAHRLHHNGFEVIGVASSGHDAIEQIKNSEPDVVLMDVRIRGELNGIEVAIVVKSYFGRAIPIIFLTGFAEATFNYLKVLDEYIYINKPVSDDVLLDAIERALLKKSMKELAEEGPPVFPSNA